MGNIFIPSFPQPGKDPPSPKHIHPQLFLFSSVLRWVNFQLRVVNTVPSAAAHLPALHVFNPPRYSFFITKYSAIKTPALDLTPGFESAGTQSSFV